uniref:Uncharacterized protein n=1 Tax=Ditylenchus dipsaci TaxID=166011 RepID=A0A915EP60_9BILA
MKLKQSIERIEKGNDPNKPSEDDSAANLNALRHALGTNAARAASVKNTTTQKSNNKTVITDDRSTTPPAHLEHTLQNGVLPTFETKQKSAILGSNMVQKKSSKSSMGCSAGDQCKGYLNKKDEFDFVKERYEDEEELLPQQIQHYLQHLSEKDKESSRLKRFSAELEMLASPLETGKRADDAYFNELLSLPPREADALTLAALNCEMEEQKMNPKNRKLYRKNLCDSCLKEERDVKNSAERVPPPTSESGCQTEFSRCLSREVLATDAAARLMQLQQHQQQQQQLQQANELVNNIAPPALPARQRKKATAKKTMQQQQQQQLMQQQQHPKANPRNARMNASLTGMQENMLPTMGLLNAMDKKPLMGANLDNNLANLAAELEIGKMQNEEMMAAQPTANSIFSRQYIEEWLRYSARNVLKLNYDNNGKPFITTRSGNDVAEICSENNLREPEISEVSTALGVIGLNCMNARNIQQKVADFVETLESHTNFREMRASIDRLLSLCSDDENFTGADDSISVVSVSESSTKDTDMSKDFADFASFPRTFAEEDPHDYMLSRELKQAEIALATRLTNIIFQLHQASLPDIVDRLAMKMESIKAHDVQVNKQCSDAHKSLQVANEKYEKLNQQLKDRKNEIKKLEKKAKSEAQLAAENSELHDKLDAFKKEVSHLQRQINEEQMKYKRDTQSLADSKKHLHVEMTSRATEIQKLSNQLEEKAQALKKSESQLANERKSNSSIISSLTERVKKAEMSLLEHKLEDGLKILERARDDCVMQIRSLEEQQKRHVFPAEQEGGKQLSQLPKLQVPRPPPCPKLYPMPVPPPAVVPPPVVMPPPVSSTAARVASPTTNNIAGPAAAAVVVPPSPLPLERKAITPPSSNRSRMGGATTPQHQMAGMGMSSNSIQSPGGSGVVTYPSSSIPNSSNATPVKNFQLHQQPPPSLPTASNVNPIAPIGVRPYNYQNGVSQQPKAPTPMMHLHQARHSPTASLGSQYANMMQQQQQQQMPVQMQQQQYLQQQQQQQQQQMQQKSQAQQQQQAVGGAYQSWVGWGDQVNNISELFCQGRSFGPLGSDFGNSAARSNGGSAGGNGNPNVNNSNSNNNNGGGFFS